MTNGKTNRKRTAGPSGYWLSQLGKLFQQLTGRHANENARALR